MNSFETLVADFAEKTGVVPGSPGADNFDVEADGVVVSAQYRAERDDCVLFSLPLEDARPDGHMLRRALELAANGAGTDGHFLGLREGMFMLSAVLPLAGLSAEEFGMRILALAAAFAKVDKLKIPDATKENLKASLLTMEKVGIFDFEAIADAALRAPVVTLADYFNAGAPAARKSAPTKFRDWPTSSSA